MLTDALHPPARRLDINWQAGDDRPAIVAAPNGDGVPRDLTGWSAIAVASRSGVPVQTWSTDDDTASCGHDGVTLYSDDSAGWAWRNATFDVRATAPDGTREVLAYGDMTVLPLRSGHPVPTPPVTPPAPAGTLLMRHGDSWRPRAQQPSSPRFALHQGGVPLRLDEWWVRAQARIEGAARPLFSWCAHLSATAGTGVELDTVRYRRRGPQDPSQPAVVDLPAMWMRLDVDDWIGKPGEWEGLFEVELTRGSLTDPFERQTIAARPLIVLPDLIP